MKPMTRDQVREFDRQAIEDLGVPGIILMENAGRQAADFAAQLLQERRGRRALVVAGGGNNGGDGFVVARHLLTRGFEVEVLLVADPGKVRGDAATNFGLLEPLGIKVTALSAEPDNVRRAISEAAEGCDLVVDALLGTGLQGQLREPLLSAIQAINSTAIPVLALDIPSGLDADSGRPLGAAVRAAATVTARVQYRVGPPLLQPVYDIVKLFGKETVLPSAARRTGFLVAPLVGPAATAVAATLVWMALLGAETSFRGDLIVVIYLLTIPSLAMILGASASGSPHAAVGASRELKISRLMLLATLPVLAIMAFWGGLGRGAEGTVTAWGVVGFALKYLAIVVLFVLIRNTNPRVRVDQAVRFFWFGLTPLAAAALLLALVWGW